MELEYLIEERIVTNGENFADEIFKEAQHLFSSSNWKIEYENKNIIIESKNITGPLANGILLGRSSFIIKGNAQKLFSYLVSSEGYALIDPACNPKDHKKPPLETYKSEKYRLEAAVANSNIPFLGKINFVVFNAIDYNNFLFVSKSIIHPKLPGGSKYSKYYNKDDKITRGLNTFAIQLKQVSQDNIQINILNYIDLCGKTNSKINNIINIKFFFKFLTKRIMKKSKKLDI